MKKTRNLSPDQIEARDARRLKFSGLAKQIADMPDNDRAALAARMAGAVTIEGRSLSAGNACLIALQDPNATILGGFQQWRQHGRTVRKGEHGIMIWAPTQRREKPAPAGAAAVLEPAAGEPSDRPGFIMVTVFDVAQTDAIGVEVAA